MDLKDDLPARINTNIPWEGYVADAPTDEDDTLTVIIPGFHPKYKWGPCFWQHRGGIALPDRDDRCLVLFDNNRRPWVVAWWPF